MENNRQQKLDRKSFFKKEFKKIIGLVILVVISIYIQPEYLPIKIALVVLVTIISFMLLNSLLLFKYSDLQNINILGHNKFFDYGPIVNYLLGHPNNYIEAKSWEKRRFLTYLGISTLFFWLILFASYIFLKMPIPTPVLVLLIISGCFTILASISKHW